jgi:GNAT superfamily N-acetyltransferase
MIEIRKMVSADSDYVREMMRCFYSSDAVATSGSEEIFESDIENCINDSPYLEGYVFWDTGVRIGYAMLAKSFSTEYGRPCIWIEDIYLLPEHRKRGVASMFFDFLKAEYPGTIQRLEVEDYNTGAIRAYEKNGFDRMPYSEMKRLIYGEGDL